MAAVITPFMRKVAAAPGGGADKYEFFFQVGANSKDEITLECGSFDMKGIMCMANEGKPQGAANRIQFKGTDAEAGGNGGFGIKGALDKPSEAVLRCKQSINCSEDPAIY